MRVYYYELRDNEARLTRGVLTAGDVRDAADQLWEKYHERCGSGLFGEVVHSVVLEEYQDPHTRGVWTRVVTHLFAHEFSGDTPGPILSLKSREAVVVTEDPEGK